MALGKLMSKNNIKELLEVAEDRLTDYNECCLQHDGV